MRIEEALELFRAVREEEIARYTEQRAGENHVPFPWLMRLALDPTSLSAGSIGSGRKLSIQPCRH